MGALPPMRRHARRAPRGRSDRLRCHVTHLDLRRLRPAALAPSEDTGRGERAGLLGHAASAKAAVTAILALAACAQRPAPADPATRVLYRDLERHVTMAATTGWGSDRLEIEDLLESSLDSTCRVDPGARRALHDWLAAEIARRGGPVERAWRDRGKDLDSVDDLLVLTRVQRLLARTEEAAADCPFWLEPEQPFRGRQISERRFVLAFSGGGRLITVRQGDSTDFNAGGAGRLLLGRAMATGDVLLAGLELGGSAAFPKDAMGERTSLVIGLDLVAPVVYRKMFTNSYVEIEAGWLGRATERDWDALDHGIHVGVAFGVRALRKRFVFPGVAFGAWWERTFQEGDDVTLLKLGGRIAFDLDL